MILCTVATAASAKETLVKNVAEFDAAVKDAKAGDVIVLADGEWRDAELVFRGQGESYEVPILLRAQTPGKVVLSGKSRLRIGGRFLKVKDLLWNETAADDATIQFRVDSKTPAVRCIVTDCAILGDRPGTERKWISMYGSYNGVQNSRFEGKQSGGTLLVVWLTEGSEFCDMDIKDNFFGPRPRLGKNGGEIIRIGDSATSQQKAYTWVIGNYFYRCDGEAEIISNKSAENRIAANTFVGCSGAVTLRHGYRCEVADNAFFGDGRKGTGGVRIIGAHHRVALNLFYELLGDDARAAVTLMNGIPDSPLNGYLQVRSAYVYSNTFIRCKENIVVGLRDEDQPKQTLPPTECFFSENSVTSTKAPVFDVRTAPQTFQHDDNVFFGPDLGLESNKGWRRVATEPKFDVTRGTIPRPGSDDDFKIEDFELPTKLTDVGPAWLRPGEEFLPEVLKERP